MNSTAREFDPSQVVDEPTEQSRANVKFARVWRTHVCRLRNGSVGVAVDGSGNYRVRSMSVWTARRLAAALVEAADAAEEAGNG